MKREIQITVPKDWSAVTLNDYIALRRDMDAYKDEPDAQIACLFHHLCHFPVEYLHQLDIDTYIKIKDDILSFIGKVDLPLQRKIKLGDIEYGFEPNLSQMSYGAYVDIAKYEKLTIDEQWAEIMSILYRPVIKSVGKLYDIETYQAKIDGKPFMDITMDVHFGALFFLNNLLKDLQNSILKSLTQNTAEIPHNIKLILERNGNLIQALSNSLKVI
jgi:hypothetical protein